MHNLPLRLLIQKRLAEVVDTEEAKAITLLLFDKLFNMTVADVLGGKDENLSDDQKSLLNSCLDRIAGGEPVQYVLGRCDFNGLELGVKPGVLIPRPETAELVNFCAGFYNADDRLKILDICTGSGCIALSLKQMLPKATVTGWDISADALTVAKQNAERLALDVSFERYDILAIDDEISEITREYDIIISNPPYVCEHEKKEMESRVVDYEPSLALFVPDSNPLIFYKHITEFAIKTLKTGGGLFFETNRLYAYDVARLISSFGFTKVEKKKDSFGNDRIVSGTLN